jgi:inosose dehydratase
MKVQYGISAINWVNEDIKEYGNHYTAEQVLSEMASLGFEGTEFCRKFLRDVDVLQQLLDSKNMVLTSQWRSVHFSDPARHEEEMEAFRAHADFLKAMGCQHVVTCESSNKKEDLANNKIHIDFKAIFEELQKRNYEGWIIVEAEQNPEIASPLYYAEIARNYLNTLTE